jgi:hypothetical protein
MILGLPRGQLRFVLAEAQRLDVGPSRIVEQIIREEMVRRKSPRHDPA